MLQGYFVVVIFGVCVCVSVDNNINNTIKNNIRPPLPSNVSRVGR